MIMDNNIITDKNYDDHIINNDSIDMFIEETIYTLTSKKLFIPIDELFETFKIDNYKSSNIIDLVNFIIENNKEDKMSLYIDNIIPLLKKYEMINISDKKSNNISINELFSLDNPNKFDLNAMFHFMYLFISKTNNMNINRLNSENNYDIIRYKVIFLSQLYDFMKENSNMLIDIKNYDIIIDMFINSDPQYKVKYKNVKIVKNYAFYTNKSLYLLNDFINRMIK